MFTVWSVSLCVCVCMCECVHEGVCLCVCVCMCECVCVCVCVCACAHACVYGVYGVCVCLCVCVCVSRLVRCQALTPQFRPHSPNVFRQFFTCLLFRSKPRRTHNLFSRRDDAPIPHSKWMLILEGPSHIHTHTHTPTPTHTNSDSE